MPPPERVNPPEDDMEAAEIPPLNVEVAPEVLVMEPPERERPVEEFNEVRFKPPDQVEVAPEVFVIEPPVRARPPAPIPKDERVMPPVYVEVAVPVTAMSGVMTDEVANTPETVVEPATKTFPWTPKTKFEPTEVVPTPA